jgi:hypothetical protein
MIAVSAVLGSRGTLIKQTDMAGSSGKVLLNQAVRRDVGE